MRHIAKDTGDARALRLLCALDRSSGARDLVRYAVTIAIRRPVTVRVVHVVEHVFPSGGALETIDEAASLVEAAVSSFRDAGVDASGAVRHAGVRRVGTALLDEASQWRADLLLLHARRTPRWRALLLGAGVREQVLRRTSISTVLVGGSTPRHEGSTSFERASGSPDRVGAVVRPARVPSARLPHDGRPA